jgi:hypothetical protein
MIVERPPSLSDLSRICEEPYAFWLDSAAVHDRLGRDSLFGSDPFLILRSYGTSIEMWTRGGTHRFSGSPFETLRRLLRQYAGDGSGLATTGGSLTDRPAERARVVAQARQLYGAIQVTPDLTFLRNMYKNGAKGYFDALGSHPYGGSYAPDTPPDQVTMPIYFRRAEEQRQVMLDHGDDSPLWNTEFGWVLETSCNLGEHEWMEVSEAKQAEYLAAAYAYAEENWPWMGPMFLFNLDFATVSWYAHCDPMRWYSITYRENPQDPGNSPILTRQAFGALRDMPKNSGW